MIFCKKFIPIVLVVILPLLPKTACASEVISQKAAVGILQNQRILSVAQRNRLKEFLNELTEDKYPKDAYEKIALALKNKVKRDIKDLKSLTFFLNELTENQFARDLGNVKKKDIKKIQKMTKKLNKQTGKLYEFKALNQDRPNEKELVKIIKRDSRALISYGDNMTTADIWKEIRNQYKKPYKAWNAKFVKMEEEYTPERGEIYGVGSSKKKVYEKPYDNTNLKSTDKRYDVEELHFMRNFDKARVIFRRLSDPNSGYF